MEKKILFRVEAGGNVGLGHFYRSYNLALSLRRINYFVTFVHLKSSFWDKIKDFEFEHIELNSNHPNKNMFDLCLKKKFELLYVDSIIEINEKYINKLDGKTKIIFYQNISESRHLADVFILPSIHQEKPFFEKFNLSKVKIFQGLKYFTFNSKVSELKSKQIDDIGRLTRIGIICGGSDPKNVMLLIFKMIDYNKWSDLSFYFYYGDNYMHHNTLPEIYPNNVNFSPYNLECINKNDVLIASFGVSTYEFMALGMPIISVGHEKANANASQILKDKTKSIYHLGFIDSLTSKKLNKTIGKFVIDLKIRKKLIKKATKIIDLKGINRVVSIIENI